MENNDNKQTKNSFVKAASVFLLMQHPMEHTREITPLTLQRKNDNAEV